jgi:hypothetical protein
MASLAGFIGTLVGAALLTALAFAITKSWPMSKQKILLICGAMFLLLSLGDNLTRAAETLPETMARIGLAELIVLVVLLVIHRGQTAPS